MVLSGDNSHLVSYSDTVRDLWKARHVNHLTVNCFPDWKMALWTGLRKTWSEGSGKITTKITQMIFKDTKYFWTIPIGNCTVQDADLPVMFLSDIQLPQVIALGVRTVAGLSLPRADRCFILPRSVLMPGLSFWSVFSPEHQSKLHRSLPKYLLKQTRSGCRRSLPPWKIIRIP